MSRVCLCVRACVCVCSCRIIRCADLISLLPPETVAGMESGEIELDFDTMDNETLLKIDAWLRTIPEAQVRTSTAAMNPSACQVWHELGTAVQHRSQQHNSRMRITCSCQIGEIL